MWQKGANRYMAKRVVPNDLTPTYVVYWFIWHCCSFCGHSSKGSLELLGYLYTLPNPIEVAGVKRKHIHIEEF